MFVLCINLKKVGPLSLICFMYFVIYSGSSALCCIFFLFIHQVKWILSLDPLQLVRLIVLPRSVSLSSCSCCILLCCSVGLLWLPCSSVWPFLKSPQNSFPGLLKLKLAFFQLFSRHQVDLLLKWSNQQYFGTVSNLPPTHFIPSNYTTTQPKCIK